MLRIMQSCGVCIRMHFVFISAHIETDSFLYFQSWTLHGAAVRTCTREYDSVSQLNLGTGHECELHPLKPVVLNLFLLLERRGEVYRNRECTYRRSS
jgi:hypothetical protein